MPYKLQALNCKPWPSTTKVLKHPTKKTRKGGRYARNNQAYPHNSTYESVHINLIRVAGPFAKHLDEVIW